MVHQFFTIKQMEVWLSKNDTKQKQLAAVNRVLPNKIRMWN